jgi:hypothetical protein
MARLVQDIWGGFDRVRAPDDNRITLRWSGQGRPRQAVGADIGRAYCAIDTQNDTFFAVNDVICFTMIPVEATAMLSGIYDGGETNYQLLPFDFSMSPAGNGLPITLVAQGVTITPAAGLSLTLKQGWRHAWLQKTAAGPGAYTAYGDLEPAA